MIVDRLRAFVLLFALLAIARVRAADSVVVFNEIHYHLPATETTGEWIELHNQMAIDIDLSAWSIADGVEFRFSEGTVIAGGGYLVLAANPKALRTATGLSSVFGPFTNRLSNTGETLELRDRNDRLMDRVEFGKGGNWPVSPGGSGPTLAKRTPNTSSAAPENWSSSLEDGGSPGRRNFPRGIPEPPQPESLPSSAVVLNEISYHAGPISPDALGGTGTSGLSCSIAAPAQSISVAGSSTPGSSSHSLRAP